MPAIVAILIRSTALLNHTLLLILGLAQLTPLGRLVLAVLLLLVTLFLRLVHSPAVVLRRAVNSDQLQRLRLGRVDELVLSTSRHNHDVRGLDVLVLASDRGTALAGCEDQDLI